MKKEYANLNVIGCDETGVGDYFSPLVAAAVFVPKQSVYKLEQMGIKDSKKITDSKILQLADKIKPQVIHRVKHLTQTGYNKLNKNLNANELKMFLHMSAINLVEDKVDSADIIILDQFSSANSIKKYYEKLGKSSFNFKKFKTKLKLVEKGESEHVAVAAASILARAFLLEYMEKQNSKWKTVFPLGTNKIVEEFAIKFIKKHGKEKLDEVAKISFKTTDKLFEMLKDKK